MRSIGALCQWGITRVHIVRYDFRLLFGTHCRWPTTNMINVVSLPAELSPLVWEHALAMYHRSSTRVRHHRVLKSITHAAIEMDRQRHFATDLQSGEWFYTSWINTSLPITELDMLQPTTFSLIDPECVN